MRKRFVLNIVFLLLVNLLIKPVWIFGIDRNIQNTVGHESYGLYQALFSFSLIFQIILDMGLQNYNHRTLARSPRAFGNLFPNILLSKSILAVVYFILICLLGALIGYTGQAFRLLALLAFVQILNSLMLYLRSNVSGLQHFKTDSLLSVSDRLMLILICGYLLFFYNGKDAFRIEWLIYAQIAAYTVSALLAFILCLKLTRISRVQFDLKKVWVISKGSLPYALLIFLMALYLRADSILIERLLPNGQEEAGVFAASFRLLDVANNISGVLFAGILLPLFGRMLARSEDVRPIVRISLNLLLPVSLTTVALAWFFGTDIMHALYTEATAYDGRVFKALMFAFPGFCIGYVYATLLTANGNIKALISISLACLLVNLLLNAFLIPALGALGAGITAAATQVVLALLNIRRARKVIGLKWDQNWIGQYALFILLVTGGGFLISRLTISLPLGVLLVGGTGLLGMLLFGFIPVKEIRQELLNRIRSSG